MSAYINANCSEIKMNRDNIKPKTFVCLKCKRFYDANFKNFPLTGRVPLILPCNHCVCEECIRAAFDAKKFICPQCNEVHEFSNGKKPQEIYQINFYVLGLIYYTKTFTGEFNKVGFKPTAFIPAGCTSRSFTNKTSSYLQHSQHSSHSSISSSVLSESICSQLNCKKPAKLKCSECCENYCDSCCNLIHKVARGLKSHNILPLNQEESSITEGNEFCLLHTTQPLEFKCNTCHSAECCYCIISDHVNHDFYKFSVLDPTNVPDFIALTEKAEEMLKCLQQAQKVVNRKLSAPSLSTLSNIDTSIAAFFANLHGKLQTIENNIRVDLKDAKNINITSLADINKELCANINVLNNLIQTARIIIKPESEINTDVNLVQERLKNALNLPCFLVGDELDLTNIEFISGDLLEDWQSRLSIGFNKEVTFKLVRKDQLPDDYDYDTNLSEVSSSSTFLSSTPCAGGYNLSPAQSKSSGLCMSRSLSPLTPNEKLQEINRSLPQNMILQIGDKESVIVTHIASPQSFYVQRVKQEHALNKLSKDIHQYVQNFPRCVAIPEINKTYIVQYKTKQSEQWCRGRLTEVHVDQTTNGDMCTIFFIDFGNTQIVPRDLLREMKPELMRPKPFAIHCTLFDIYPTGDAWTVKDTALMVQIIKRRQVMIVVVNNNSETLEIDVLAESIVDKGLISIRDALLFTSNAKFKYENRRADEIHNLKSRTQIKYYHNNDNYRRNRALTVVISDAVDPYNIYVQRVDWLQLLNKLHDSMKEYYKNYNKEYVYTPQKDMAVAVFKNVDGDPVWYRASVLDTIAGRGTVKLRLVDYGTTASVSYTFIRKLPEQFTKFELFAILIKLADIEPLNSGTWNENACKFFNSYKNDRTFLEMTVSGEGTPLEVVLFENYATSNVCINAMLVDNGLADSIGPLSQTKEWPKQKAEEKDKENPFILSLMKTVQGKKGTVSESDSEEEKLPVAHIPIEVRLVKNPHLMYVQSKHPDVITEQRELKYKLKELYLADHCLGKSWSVNDRCVAYHMKNYFRARILEVNNDLFKVILVDEGTEITVSQENLLVLTEDLNSYGNGTFKCSLKGIKPAGDKNTWSMLAVEFLQDIFKAHKDHIYFNKAGEVDEKKIIPAVMWYSEFIPGQALEPSKTQMHNINKLLINNGLALKDKPSLETVQESHDLMQEKPEPENKKVSWNELMVVPPSEAQKLPMVVPPSKAQKLSPKISTHPLTDWLPPVRFTKTKFTAIVTFVGDDATIYLHEAALEPVFTSMEEKMNNYFNTTEPDLHAKWVPGQMCTAKYHMNNHWYRARILSVQDGAIKVTMIDYGNEEDVKPEELRRHIMYLDLPTFAGAIYLHKVFCSTTKWLTIDLDNLHKTIVDKTIHVTLKGPQLQGNPTPAVVVLDDLNINGFMLKISKNLSSQKLKTEVVSDEEDVIVEGEISDSTNSLSFRVAPLPEATNIKLQGIVVNIVNYDKCVLQIEDFEDKKVADNFEQLSQQIQECSESQPILENLQLGHPCVAKYSQDNNWYRAEIKDLNDLNFGLVNVWFVDFGNFEIISTDMIREIRKEWCDFPVHHYLAQIDGIKLATDSLLQVVLDNMYENTNHVNLVKIVTRNPLRIQLYEKKDPEVLAYQKLIDNGLLTLKTAD